MKDAILFANHQPNLDFAWVAANWHLLDAQQLCRRPLRPLAGTESVECNSITLALV
ncbi:hypothetical protein NF556_05660 [Ornithinimicrobium faecis]|uniref:Uncharacterized protein n=1 Tax=Ornithinimicrobium faecis TaxID=2934158 RepID=A0ABY4YWI6_9MICO|nr:hypothetical protein [Ornithinimicrobium sp. HY1793]USQ81131.1 hypothetical protein NF556_05660 [Ornithinimicrobium sp. HY1793]